AVRPPSTARLVPVMNEASSEASQRIGKAISSGSAQRFRRDPTAPRSFSSETLMPRAPARPAVHGVNVEPGQTAFTRIPCGASSQARTRVMARMAALVASYCPMFERPLSAKAEDTLTMLPPLLLRRKGKVARQQLASPRMLVCRIFDQLSEEASAIDPYARLAALLIRISIPPK